MAFIHFLIVLCKNKTGELGPLFMVTYSKGDYKIGTSLVYSIPFEQFSLG